MKVVVVGGTGLIGSKLVARLGEHGHEAVAAAPQTGVNTLTGAGPAGALTVLQEAGTGVAVRRCARVAGRVFDHDGHRVGARRDERRVAFGVVLEDGNNRDDVPPRFTVTMLCEPGQPMFTLVDEDGLRRRADRRTSRTGA
ncbi:NAD-dependent epimerase/dehydratase family protein [Nonomuraea sp. NPDC049714]|uniref:NAD-dependent epimerase/dehydratase family protein n=1 Tax=Nonomuraea sp. NPDC049714 TaxID=3364357 RepID=UPI00378B3DA1